MSQSPSSGLQWTIVTRRSLIFLTIFFMSILFLRRELAVISPFSQTKRIPTGTSSRGSITSSSTKEVDYAVDFALPELEHLFRPMDILSKSEHIVKETLGKMALEPKTQSLVRRYNVGKVTTRNNQNTLRVGILTNLGMDGDRYSLNVTGYAQLSKLLLAERLQRVAGVDAQAIFDTTNYLQRLHEHNSTRFPIHTNYSLSPKQEQTCGVIFFGDEEVRCFPDNDVPVDHKARDGIDIVNCTRIPLHVTPHWNKVASLLYWSSFFDVIIMTDDDTWVGDAIKPIQTMIESILLSNTTSSSTFLTVPIEFPGRMSGFGFSNYVFMLNVRPPQGLEFLLKWWETRLTPVVHGDQGGMFQAIAPYFMNDILSRNRSVHPKFVFSDVMKEWQMLKLCHARHILTQLALPFAVIRPETRNWTVAFASDENFSVNINWSPYGNGNPNFRTTEGIFQDMVMKRTFVHARPVHPYYDDVTIKEWSSLYENSTDMEAFGAGREYFAAIVHKYFEQLLVNADY